MLSGMIARLDAAEFDSTEAEDQGGRQSPD
jgi:hypothetical protein